MIQSTKYRYSGSSLAVRYKEYLLHIFNSMLVPCGGAFNERKKISEHLRSTHSKVLLLSWKSQERV